MNAACQLRIRSVPAVNDRTFLIHWKQFVTAVVFVKTKRPVCRFIFSIAQIVKEYLDRVVDVPEHRVRARFMIQHEFIVFHGYS